MRDRYSFKGILIFFITVSVFLTNIDTKLTVQGVEINDVYNFFSDYRGNFMYTCMNGSLSCVYRMQGNGKTTLLYEDAPKADLVYCTDNHTYVLTQTQHNVLVGKIAGGSIRSFFLDGICIKKNCLVVDNMGIIYAADENNDNYIRVFDSDGNDINKYDTYGNIRMIFYDVSTSDVFAVADSGLFNVTAGFTKISSIVPDGEIIINDRLCTDTSGNVFEFDPIYGFKKIFNSDCDLLCPTNEAVYGINNKTLYKLDYSGRKVSYINLSVKPEQLMSSKKNLAYVYKNKITVINLSDMEKVQIEHELSEEENSRSPNEESVVSHMSEKSDTDVSHTSEESGDVIYRPTEESENSESEVEDDQRYKISSDDIEISGEYIFLNQGMTLAEIKRCINYNDNKLRVINHNGKTVTSGNVGTGWKMIFSGNTEKTFYTVLPGDITGEGNINSRDIKKLSDYLIDDIDLSTVFLFSADVDENGVINLLDLYKIYKNY